MNAYKIRHKPTGKYWDSYRPILVPMAIPSNHQYQNRDLSKGMMVNTNLSDEGRVWLIRPKSVRQVIKNKVMLGNFKWTNGYCQSVDEPVIISDWELVEYELVEKRVYA